MNDETFDQAVKFIRDKIPGTRSSHAHAVLAHALGYNSKKALLDDPDISLDDKNLVMSAQLDNGFILSKVAAMGETPLKHIGAERLSETLFGALAPACECCHEKSRAIKPLGCDDPDPDGWVCEHCVQTTAAYDHCELCGNEYVYRSDQINSAGECPEHAGESKFDSEEQEDWGSYIENVQNNM